MDDSYEERTQQLLSQMQPPPQQEPAAAPLPQPSAAKQEPPPEQPSGLLQFLHLDSDALLILPLLLLFMREGADNALLLALVYVLL